MEKLIAIESNGRKNIFGKLNPSANSRESIVDLTLNSYLYGTLTLCPDSLTPGNLVLSTIKASEIPT